MRDLLNDLSEGLSHPDPILRAQIQMQKPLPKRFYKDVTVGEAEEGGFTILLDGKPLRTPAKKPLTVPTRALAELHQIANAANKATDAAERARLKGELLAAGWLIGLLQQDPVAWLKGTGAAAVDAAAIDALIAERKAARARKDWAESDRGRRLDHMWASPAIADNAISHRVAEPCRGWTRPSDHAPLITEFQF